MTSQKMVLTAGKLATWELPSPRPAYQFRFLLQEGENPTRGGEGLGVGPAQGHRSVQRFQQHPRTSFLPLHLLLSFPSPDDSLVVIRWLQQLWVQACGNENA